MKKRFVVFLSAILTLFLAACNINPSSSSSSSSLKPSSSSSSSSTSVAHPLEGQSIAIHYYRYDNDYSGWALWLWERGKDGAEYQFTETDDYGAVAKVPLTKWTKNVVSNDLGFIVKTKGSWGAKDVDADRYINFANVQKDASNTYNVYLKTGDPTIYTAASEVVKQDIISCAFTSTTQIAFAVSREISNYKIYQDDEVIANVDVTSQFTSFTYEFPENQSAILSCNYKVEVTYRGGEEKTIKNVDINKLYSTTEFSSQFTYDGNDLGATYTSSKTTFKVWSPVSSEIKLRIYESGTPKSVDQELGNDTILKEVAMEKGEKGVWSVEVEGDLEGKYYTYVVTNSSYKDQEVVDPYAKSAGVNGLRGMIVDFAKTNPEGWDNVNPHPYSRTELVVYETHVSDLSSSKSWSQNTEHAQYAKKFKGAYLEGTTYTESGVTVTTGFDHIKELGVNAVQFVPIYDQANDEINLEFNWGYNPLNYNCLEGGYSSNPHDGYVRIREFKELVKAYNGAGINVIMDVVYNHVANAAGSNFDVLVPGYYFRYNPNGSFSNGSGCGNETASEMPMFRKFMIDSTEFWAREYKLGGFRFDLMGLHDLTTMDQLVANLKTYNENIVVYGEPWTGGTSTLQDNLSCKQSNTSKYQGYGQFNDQFRDALVKGGMNSASSRGWVNALSATPQADLDRIKGGIRGFTDFGTGTRVADPLKTVNYVTCHDNYTLYDRMAAAGVTGYFDKQSTSMLANSVILTSQGTTFILAGEEFLRTKGGDENSYQSSYETNELNYALKVSYSKIFENYKKLIALKTSVDGLQYTTAQECGTIQVTFNGSNQIVYEIKDSANNRTYKIIHNNGYNPDSLPTMDLTGYTLYLDTCLTKTTSIQLSSATQFSPYQTVIVYKDN